MALLLSETLPDHLSARLRRGFELRNFRFTVSLKRNIIASYVSQIFVTAIGIAILPLYLKYLGAEAYGLVGFFAMLQAWFNILDLGLSPTMAQQTARFQGGAMAALSLRRLLRALEGVFVFIALLGAGAIVAAADLVATQWLKVQSLPLSEVRNAVVLMGLIAALRWVSSLYRGVVAGFERLVWLSSWNAFIATLRFVLVIPLFFLFGATPSIYFAYQLGVAVLELTVLVSKAYRLMPQGDTGKRTTWQWQPLRDVLKFSLGIAFAGTVWILVTQVDKLILSKILTLADYGYFSIAVLVAGGVFMASGPVGSSLMPRMTRLQAEGRDAAVVELYRNATQLVAVIAVPAILLLTFFSKQVLWAWTGDDALVDKAAPILTLYALGYGIFVFSAFPYYLQYAKGDLRLHLIGNMLLVLLFVPSLIFASKYYGMTGAGWSWLILNIVYFVVWIPLVHKRFLNCRHLDWLGKDVLLPSVPAALMAWLIQSTMPWPDSRIAIGFQLFVFGFLLLMITGLSSNKVRSYVSNTYRLRTSL